MTAIAKYINALMNLQPGTAPNWLGEKKSIAARGRVSIASMAIAGTIIFLACLWGGLFVYLDFAKRHAYLGAEQNGAGMVRALEEHTLSTVRGIDQTTRFTKYQYERLGNKLDLENLARQSVFLDKIFNLIGIIDADGWLLMADRSLPKSNLSDREHFYTHVGGDAGQMFISKPVLGRSSGKWSVQFTRRLNNGGGDFGGVVVVSLDPGYFNRFYRSIGIGENGVVTLVGADGIVRARSNSNTADSNTENAGQDLRGTQLFQALKQADYGSYVSTSQIDGIRRLFSFRKLPDYPLVVVIGISEATVLKDYFGHRNVSMGLGALITLLIAAAAAALVARLRLQQRMEEALRQSEQDALSANKMKTEFLARMSHELRTPLNGILGYTEYLSESGESAKNRECAAAIYESGNHLLRIVNTILDLAKIEAGHMEVDREPLEVAQLINQVVVIQRAFADQKGLQIDVHFAPDVPKTITGDRTKLAQVLNNLIHNSIKFTDNGGIEIFVTLQPEEVLVAVRDTGRGIPASSHQLVFERFKQVDAFATRSQNGTGLGLSLARELVELMGGRIWFESCEGEGAVFYFTVPHVKGTA